MDYLDPKAIALRETELQQLQARSLNNAIMLGFTLDDHKRIDKILSDCIAIAHQGRIPDFNQFNSKESFFVAMCAILGIAELSLQAIRKIVVDMKG